MTYLDTSALIKRFVTERGSKLVRRLVAQPPAVATSKIAYAEVHAALARKRREGRVAAAGYRVACRQFEQDWKAYVRVELADEVLAQVRDLVVRHPLRGFDAIHLASALVLRARLGEPRTFAAADDRLLRAAASEAFRALDVEAAPTG